MPDNSAITHLVKSTAAAEGFSFCGIVKAEQLHDEAYQLEQWLNANRHGKMHYMENYFDKRIDPTKLVPGAKSVISLMYNYHTTAQQNADYKIATYAYGEDYHEVIKNKLRQMLITLEESIGNFEARIFVDSAPVLEKAWAKRSGLGWQGKNTNIINPKAGSFFFWQR